MATSEKVEKIILYYVNLLIIQYFNKLNARSTIDAVVRQVIADGTVFDVRDGFSIDTAVGVQLDIIGKYVGVDRFYNSEDITGIHFGFSDAFSVEPIGTTGYADTSDFFSKDGSYLSSSDIVGTGFSLSDSDYRTIIKLKILLNNSDFSDKSIDDDLFAIFGNGLYMVDDLDMSLTYFTNPDLSLIVRVALSKGLLPKPMAVRINALIEDYTYFGYSDGDSIEPEGVTGYAAASDFLAKDGTFLGTINIIA